MTATVTAERVSLSQEHLTALQVDSGIPDGLIAQRGYRTMRTKAELRQHGFAESQLVVPSMLLPVWGVQGDIVSYQNRPDHPRLNERGKPVKYEIPAKTQMVMDVHPAVHHLLGDPAVPLFVTEGVKKGDALAGRHCCAVALLGVWNWRGRNPAGGLTALADWESIALKGRRVYVVFDSDVMVKPEVHRALARLKPFLEYRGSDVAPIYLPPGTGGVKQGVDDFFAAGGTVPELMRLASPDLLLPSEEPDPRTIWVGNRHIHDMASDAWKRLAQDDGAPELYRRGGQVVRVLPDDAGTPQIKPLSPPELRGFIDRSADWVGLDKNDQMVKARPPKDVVDDMLAHHDHLSLLMGITSIPVFSPEGKLSTEPGYDKESQLFYAPSGPPVPPVPETPSDADVADAVALLNEWLCDFRFADRCSFVHVIAGLLTQVCRGLYSGPAPLFALDAPVQGSGKGLLAQTMGEIVLGKPPVLTNEVPDEAEMRKRVTALLLEGSQMVVFDNVVHRLSSPTLAALLTASMWTDRLLGLSQTVRLPNRTLWVVTGNNLQFSPDNARRVVWSRQDPHSDRPWERTGFKHDPLQEWVHEERHRLVWALLVLVAHWLAAGRPRWAGRPMGSFEGWCQTVGGVLQAAGVEGFLANRDDLYQQADAESSDWRAFTAAWWERFGDQPVKTSDLLPLLQVDELLPSVMERMKPGSGDQGLRIRLGKEIGKRRDRQFGELVIKRLGEDGHAKGVLYGLRRAEDVEPAATSSAHPPRPIRPILGTNAENAEDAESVSTSDSVARSMGGGARDTWEDKETWEEKEAWLTPHDPPHPPHPPHTGTKTGSGDAEDRAEDAINPPHDPPQCDGPWREEY